MLDDGLQNTGHQDPCFCTIRCLDVKRCTVDTIGASRKDVMERLQQQLKAMKTLKLRRLTTGAEVGLVDSGATHALRPRKDGENVPLYPLVDVGLADGRAVRLRMTRTADGGVGVSDCLE